MIRAVVFDLDGVLIDSEPVWETVRRDYVERLGGVWQPDSQHRMMGMSTGEWSQFMADDLRVDKAAPDIAGDVIALMSDAYAAHLPILPRSVETVRLLAERYPLGLASSSPRALIDAVLRATGLADAFAVTRSTEEERHGKPAPDVYLAVADALQAEPVTCTAVEDSTNGIRSAASAGMTVIAIPQAAFPVAEDVLKLAVRVLDRLDDLPSAIEALS